MSPLKLETPSQLILSSESDGERAPLPVHRFIKGFIFSLCTLVLLSILPRPIPICVLYTTQPCPISALIILPQDPIGLCSPLVVSWSHRIVGQPRYLHLLNLRPIIAMSAPKERRVHYERGTKGGKSSHRQSRDSGVGSSSASDRASMGTPDEDIPFSRQQIEKQRQQLGAVQEALDAAYEKIRQLEESKARLNESLAESNKENRQLKRERLELMTKIDFMTEEKRSKEKSRREPASPRTGTSSASSGSRTERASPPRRLEEPRRIEDGSQASGRRVIRRESAHERAPPVVPQAPYNSSPNPFTPVSSRPSSGTYIVPIQTAVTYAPAPVTYTAAPAFPSSPATSKYPNDGRYHPYPL